MLAATLEPHDSNRTILDRPILDSESPISVPLRSAHLGCNPFTGSLYVVAIEPCSDAGFPCPAFKWQEKLEKVPIEVSLEIANVLQLMESPGREGVKGYPTEAVEFPEVGAI